MEDEEFQDGEPDFYDNGDDEDPSDESSHSREKSKKKKSKTFNDLDERFQITEQHDPEHIFPEEYEMIAELRKRIPELSGYYSDKMLVFFLCARRHDIDQTETLLRRYLEKRKELGLEHHQTPHVFNDPGILGLLHSKAAFHVPGGRDKHDRYLLYVWLRRMKKGHSLRTMMLWYMFETDWMVHHETLSHLRNGTVSSIWVMDVSGASVMKNLDTSPEGRAWSKEMSGTFPIRIRAIYCFNAGFFIRALLSVAKWILPKKLMDRINVVDKKALEDLIPAEHFLEEFGGKLQIDHDAGLAFLEENQKVLQEARLALGRKHQKNTEEAKKDKKNKGKSKSSHNK